MATGTAPTLIAASVLLGLCLAPSYYLEIERTALDWVVAAARTRA